MSLFLSGFRSLADATCVAALPIASNANRGNCIEGYLITPPDSARNSFDLPKAIDFATTEVPIWLRQLDPFPLPPRAAASVAPALANEITTGETPFSAIVGLAVIREIPETATPGLLEWILQHANETATQSLAFEALRRRPNDVPLRVLMEAARDPDGRIARMSLRVLAARSDGEAGVRAWLEDNSFEVSPSLMLDMGPVLLQSGLASDTHVMARLLRSTNPASRCAAAQALSNAEVGDVDPELLPALLEIAAQDDTGWVQRQTQQYALAAVRSADVASQLLPEIAGRDDLPFRSRMTALEVWNARPVLAEPFALPLLQQAESASDASVIADMLASDPGPRRRLVDALSEWLSAHPDERREFLSSLASSRRPELHALYSDLNDTPDN